MQTRRQAIEGESQQAQVSADFLASQRREIYAKIDRRSSYWAWEGVRRWASAAATLLVLVGGIAVYEGHHQPAVMNSSMSQTQISDAQLAAEVSSMSQDTEAASTAPLQALFE